MSILPYKILIVGDGGVGKTTYIKRFHEGKFEQKYVPTMGVEVTPIPVRTNRGNRILNIWDCAGQEKFGGMGWGYYPGAHAAIIMFDVTSRLSYKAVKHWYKDIQKKCPGIPVVICGNKADCKDRKVKPKDITYPQEHNLQFYLISAKSNYNFEKPFLYLLRQLEDDEELRFV